MRSTMKVGMALSLWLACGCAAPDDPWERSGEVEPGYPGVEATVTAGGEGTAVGEEPGAGEEPGNEAVQTPGSLVGPGIPIKKCPAKTGKFVALTFDDGPSPFTDRLLGYLADKAAPAAFFLKGKKLADNFTGHAEHRARVARIAAAGHEICNHTFSHSGLVGPSEAAVRADMLDAEDLIADVTGRRTRCMRPPYGDHNPAVLSILEDLDYRVIMWSLNTDDWKYASIEYPNDLSIPKMLDLVTKTLQQGADPLIHIQHDAEDSEPSVDAVPQVIDAIRAQGYTLISLSECLGEPIDVAAD
ncbi:polysaccharide deacetylase family protein [Chondromyces apiculatus]|uniref:Glycosyl hydrolase n=1 Tax=Chondromyces apiculatus DSM 436 TaxID=1192034 RepID=A0A017SXC7_9BACT|nr:polysaccharide deacetylase family protein [Chondromyces apiculatus]EYF01588.1 glycosyl hydrolase [Chondromyces apiculatus DSM 436]